MTKEAKNLHTEENTKNNNDYKNKAYYVNIGEYRKYRINYIGSYFNFTKYIESK